MHTDLSSLKADEIELKRRKERLEETVQQINAEMEEAKRKVNSKAQKDYEKLEEECNSARKEIT